MKKLALAIALSLLLSVGTVSGAANASKLTGPCKKAGVVKTVGTAKAQCVKSGKKLRWQKLQVPAPLNLSGNSDRSQINYAWQFPNNIEKVQSFELGISFLRSPGLPPTSSASFSPAEVFSVVSGTSASISHADLKSFLERRTTNPSTQAVLIRVRAVSIDGTSDWSGGIYTLYSDINVTPTPSPTPTVSVPPVTQAPIQPPSSSGQSTPTPTPTPTASAPTSSIRTFSGFDSVRCPSGNAVNAGLGNIPRTVWSDFMGNPLDYVTHRTATLSWQGGSPVAYARGQSTIYQLDRGGSFLAPNGSRYVGWGPGSWSAPVWISCLITG
jgi:hypothetical protein